MSHENTWDNVDDLINSYMYFREKLYGSVISNFKLSDAGSKGILVKYGDGTSDYASFKHLVTDAVACIEKCRKLNLL